MYLISALYERDSNFSNVFLSLSLWGIHIYIYFKQKVVYLKYICTYNIYIYMNF